MVEFFTFCNFGLSRSAGRLARYIFIPLQMNWQIQKLQIYPQRQLERGEQGMLVLITVSTCYVTSQVIPTYVHGIENVIRIYVIPHLSHGLDDDF